VDDEFKLHDDTIRNLETLAHAPGELRFRSALVQAIKDLRKELAMMRVSNAADFADIKKRQLDYRDVAKVAKTEIKADKDLNQMKVDVKRLWSGAMWLIVLITGGVLAEGLRLLLGAPK
jgi:hypothetical protein